MFTTPLRPSKKEIVFGYFVRYSAIALFSKLPIFKSKYDFKLIF